MKCKKKIESLRRKIDEIEPCRLCIEDKEECEHGGEIQFPPGFIERRESCGSCVHKYWLMNESWCNAPYMREDNCRITVRFSDCCNLFKHWRDT